MDATMTTDIDKLRDMAGKAAHDMTVKKYTSSVSISEFEIAAKPQTIIALIDALEAANKRIAELENKIAIEEGVFSQKSPAIQLRTRGKLIQIRDNTGAELLATRKKLSQASSSG